jgi:hypothetical protein
MGSPSKSFVVVLCVLGLLVPPAALAGKRDKPVIAKDGIREVYGAENGKYIAWIQNSRERRGHYNLYAKRKSNKARRINPKGTSGAMGGLSGARLAYQVYNSRKNRSDLRLLSLRSGKHRSLPASVNTRRWEYSAGLSGRWLAFVRVTRSGTKLMLTNLKNGSTKSLRRTTGNRIIEVGQVNGGFLVWVEYNVEHPNRFAEVYRHKIGSNSKRNISEGDRLGYAPSVRKDGVVYLARSGNGCAKNTTLERWSRGKRSVEWRPPDGFEILTTEVFQPAGKKPRILHDRTHCKRGLQSADIYRLIAR